MSPTSRHQPPRALCYVRVSTDGQAESGAGLDAQRAAITSALAPREWEVSWVVEEGRSGKDMNRPALTEALALLDAGRADVLVVSKLDRLSRSVHDFSGLVKRAEKHGWSVLCLDINVDTTTPSGSFMATVVSGAAEYERRLVSQRTRDALAAKRAAGVRLGRPSSLPVEVVERIVRAHREGQSLRSIAASLNADGVPTAQGAPAWSHVVVGKVARSQDAQSVA